MLYFVAKFSGGIARKEVRDDFRKDEWIGKKQLGNQGYV
jgi:hypothetical protein